MRAAGAGAESLDGPIMKVLRTFIIGPIGFQIASNFSIPARLEGYTPG
jgi:hypothetical protein